MALPPALQKRVGPFSLGGWLAIGVAGIAVGLLIRRSGLFNNKAAEPLESFDDDGNPITASPVPQAYWPSGMVPVGAAPPGQTSTPAPADQVQETNLEWSRRAITWLLGQGVDATAADAGIRKYMEGQALTNAELSAVQRALASPQVGVPPEYVPPPLMGEAPPEAPAPPRVPESPLHSVVAEAYRDVLGRDPEPGGLAYWVAQIQTGAITTTEQLRTAMRQSAEAQIVYS